MGSFDVTNVHPVTTNANGTYSDPAIAAAIRKSNLLINSGALAPRPVYGALKVCSGRLEACVCVKSHSPTHLQHYTRIRVCAPTCSPPMKHTTHEVILLSS